MAKVELKQPIVDEIKAQLDGAKSMVVVDYRGISVADVTELRKQCREAGVVYKVYKNTMVKRAVEGTEFRRRCKRFGRNKRICNFQRRCNSSSKNRC